MSNYEFVKVFEHDGTTFGAHYKAEKWLSDNGYSVGSSCIGHPSYIKKGDYLIAKARNLTGREKSLSDGILESGRDSDATIKLKVKP